MQQISVRKNKIAISKRFIFNIAILFLFLSFGCGLSIAEPVISTNNNPMYPVSASVSVVEGAKPLEVIFSIEEGNTTRFAYGVYAWSFGDGKVAEGAEVRHVYEYGGMFAPSVKVRFSNGHDEIVPLSKINVFNVLNEEVVVEALTPSPAPEVPEAPKATEEAEETSEATEETEETSEATEETEEALEATEETEEALEVTEETEEILEATPTPKATEAPVVITPAPTATPNAAEGFSVTIVPNKYHGPTPVQIRFTSRTEGGVPLSWIWDFGDGDRSTVRKPAHNYGSPGTYEVRLSVEFLGPVWVDAEPVIITVA